MQKQQEKQSSQSDLSNEVLFKVTKGIILEKLRLMKPDFVVDDENRETLRTLALYFSSDKRFETEGHGELKKGIFLSGNVGVGKTIIMRAISMSYGSPHVYVVNTTTINHKYMAHGIGGIDEYFTRKILPSYDRTTGQDISAPVAYCFDDLGAEEVKVNYMGNPVSTMEQIILQRYERRIDPQLTHFTSNLDADGVEALYGTRVRSRLREMVNFIVLDGKDRRI